MLIINHHGRLLYLTKLLLKVKGELEDLDFFIAFGIKLLMLSSIIFSLPAACFITGEYSSLLLEVPIIVPI